MTTNELINLLQKYPDHFTVKSYVERLEEPAEERDIIEVFHAAAGKVVYLEAIDLD